MKIELQKCECWRCHKFTYLYEVVEGEYGANEEGGQYCIKCIKIKYFLSEDTTDTLSIVDS